jgi:uncharacterized protein (TIGR03437 family)
VTIGNQAGGVLIDVVAPGLFGMNGDGNAVGVPTVASHPGSDAGVLTLYGTGIRGASSLQHVAASIGGLPATVKYAGAHQSVSGLDQVDLIVPPSLAGSGELPVILTVDGQTANVVSVNVTLSPVTLSRLRP